MGFKRKTLLDAWSLNGEVELYIGRRGDDSIEKWISPEEAEAFAERLKKAAADARAKMNTRPEDLK